LQILYGDITALLLTSLSSEAKQRLCSRVPVLFRGEYGNRTVFAPAPTWRRSGLFTGYNTLL
jgi:hypothetical protein